MKTKLITIFLVVFAYVFAFISDFLIKRYQNLSPLTKHMIPFGTEIVAYLIITTLLLWIAWLVLYKLRSGWITSLVFIVLGAFLLYSISIRGTFFLGGFFARLPYSWNSAFVDIATSRYAFVRVVSSMILVIGLINLFPKRTLWKPNDTN